MELLHKKNIAGWVAAVLLALTSWMSPRMGWTAPLEVYGRLPSVEDVALSPSGTRIALVRTTANDRVLFLLSLDNHKLLGKPLRLGSVKLRSIQWADDSHLMIVISDTTMPMGLVGRVHEWYLLNVWDVDKQKMSGYPDPAKSDEQRIMNVLSDDVMIRHLDGHTVLFVPGIYITDETLPALFRVDLASGAQRLIREGDTKTEGWLVDEKGEIAAEEDYDQKEQRWRMLDRRDGRLREIASGHEPIDIPELLGFGPEPGTLLVETQEDGDPVWRLLSLKDGTFGPEMNERDSLEAPIEDPLTYRMVGGMHLDDAPHYVFFDRKWQSLWHSITDGFADEQVRFISSSADFRKVVVLVNGPLHGYAYELMDLKTFKAEPVGEAYEGVGVPLEVKRVTYEAADGLQIPAYLTFPRGNAPKNLPLIVFPHGGPASRDTAEFDWWAQAMASQGYLVLQPNFRGSTNTTSHLQAGFGEWGRKMQTDLSDGVRYLVRQGLADPARVCIVGASYGGYAALAGVTLDPGVYRCAVSVAGISDLKHMLQDVNPYNDRSRRYWNRFIGVSGPSDPRLLQLSPIKHVAAINVPVMLIHGRDDTVVRFDQSSAMFDAMKHAKKDVEMVTLKKEDHWLSRSETRLQMLQSSMAFLRAHNPPD
jgi:dipeptidyl aminopeptidase/acylaminoacyl peptidase